MIDLEVQYFTCSLLTIRVPEEGVVDMGAFFEAHRRVTMGAFTTMFLVAMLGNYLYRSLYAGWLDANTNCLIGLPAIGVAALAKSKWLQWAAGAFIFR